MYIEPKKFDRLIIGVTSIKLKDNRNVIEFDMKNLSAKKHKETKEACISFKSIIFVKKQILPLP